MSDLDFKVKTCKYHDSQLIIREPVFVPIQGSGSSYCSINKPTIKTSCDGDIINCLHKTDPKILNLVAEIRTQLETQKIKISDYLELLKQVFDSPYR